MTAYGPGHTPAGRLVGWLDERAGVAKAARTAAVYAFPRHWSFLLGELALYSFVVLVVTGVVLALLFEPSGEQVVYDGVYEPLRGVTVSVAYRSALDISLVQPGGLLLRQTHHWAALVFTAAIGLHLLRVLLTGAFRRPRELTWLVGVTMLALSLAQGFAGYTLLDDLLSGSAMRIGATNMRALPFVGPWVARLVFGEQYPGSEVVSRLYPLHVFVLPVLLGGLIGLHLWLVARLRHTQFPGRGRSERNVVGTPLWPAYAAKSSGFALLIAGTLVAMGGLLQINAVWLYGPYDPFLASSGSQADWYLLWVQGLMKLMPGWEPSLLGLTLPNSFIPALLIPIGAFAVLAAWPWIDRWVSGDRAPHHLLQRPCEVPWRTGVAAAGVTALALLILAGVDDIVSTELDLSIVVVRNLERVALLTLPPLVGVLTAWRCRRVTHVRT
jgi:ubiquinol-cytochrome c reductase cytochrome b subunit